MDRIKDERVKRIIIIIILAIALINGLRCIIDEQLGIRLISKYTGDTNGNKYSYVDYENNKFLYATSNGIKTFPFVFGDSVYEYSIDEEKDSLLYMQKVPGEIVQDRVHYGEKSVILLSEYGIHEASPSTARILTDDGKLSTIEQLSNVWLLKVIGNNIYYSDRIVELDANDGSESNMILGVYNSVKNEKNDEIYKSKDNWLRYENITANDKYMYILDYYDDGSGDAVRIDLNTYEKKYYKAKKNERFCSVCLVDDTTAILCASKESKKETMLKLYLYNESFPDGKLLNTVNHDKSVSYSSGGGVNWGDSMTFKDGELFFSDIYGNIWRMNAETGKLYKIIEKETIFDNHCNDECISDNLLNFTKDYIIADVYTKRDNRVFLFFDYKGNLKDKKRVSL
ncbi:MAG: hypothetical protein PUJ11_03570 [Eubacteriaceae bacterium]|nr:hypothetical protein [Eubacteriaceae bacterium]